MSVFVQAGLPLVGLVVVKASPEPSVARQKDEEGQVRASRSALLSMYGPLVQIALVVEVRTLVPLTPMQRCAQGHESPVRASVEAPR
jgi:hypothetical protein